MQRIFRHSVFVFFSTFLSCTHSPPTQEEKVDWIVDKVDDELTLNSEQKQKLNRIAQMFFEHEHTNYKEELKKYFSLEGFDSDGAQLYLDAEQEEFAKLTKRLLPMLQEFYSSLNLDQKKRFMAFYEKSMKR